MAVCQRTIRSAIILILCEEANGRLLARPQFASGLSSFNSADDGWNFTKHDHLVAVTINLPHSSFQSITTAIVTALGHSFCTIKQSRASYMLGGT